MFEAILAAAWLAFLVHALAARGGFAASFFNNGVYYGLIVAAAIGCITRAFAHAHNRSAWALIGAALTVWTIGDVYYLFRLQDLAVTPVPSLADVFYLLYFPLIWVGVVLLMRRRLVSATRALWLDGVTAALTVAAVACSLLLGPLHAATEGSMAAIATNLAYPLGDVVLLALLTALAAAQGFRLDRGSLLLVAGLVSAAAADSMYLMQSAHGTYTEGGPTDALWAASLLLIGAAAWRDEPATFAPSVWRPIAALPLICASVAIALLCASNWRSLGALGPALAGAALVTVLVRLALTLRENNQLLATTHDAAFADALTGLSNRRALMRDLAYMTPSATLENPLALVLFDLNGFKSYNDRFGHPAGDALLERLGGRLHGLESDNVHVYRLGGDEFCLLAKSTTSAAAGIIDLAVAALSEEAEGFSVSASFGAAFVPEEAADVADAMRLADVRLYSRKADFYAGHARPHDELLRLLDTRDPGTAATRELAAGIARELAASLGLDLNAQEDVARATLLRDVGTLALPDDIAHPRRTLTDAEMRLLHQHPRIGERMLSALPTLQSIAPIVGTSHEHWDGSGFPDRLAGPDLSLAARIVAASSAYASNLAQPTRGTSPDVGDLAGNVLDPQVVAGLLEHVAARRVEGPAAGHTGTTKERAADSAQAYTVRSPVPRDSLS